MPHITEDTVSNLRDRMVPGARLVRRFWSTEDAAHRFVGEFFTVESAKSDGDGWISLTYLSGGERKAETVHVHYGPDDVVGIVEMKPLGGTSDVMTYAHHDDRLILPGGYMDARPGTMHGVWDVFGADGAPVAEGVGVAEGRARLHALWCGEPYRV